jgi:hypothetical protein
LEHPIESVSIMKLLTCGLTVAFAATGLVGAATAAAVPVDQSKAPAVQALNIRHQVVGCHTWSLNGGPYKPAQSLRLAPGASLAITDNDVMAHQLVRVSGPRVTYRLTNAGAMMPGMMTAPYASGMMPHAAATLRVTFPAKGVYVFRTKAGEDYMKGVKTTGPDNVLRLVVTVR